MTSKLMVCAQDQAIPVPLEGGGGTIGLDPVQVPDTWYYRRQIRDGSLRLVADSEQGPADSAGPSLDNDASPGPATTNSKKA
jgi:hypothetical protein